MSVVIPAFNYGQFVGEALDSVRAQSWPDWECVVIDDGSTDDTREVALGFARLDPRIRYVWQENRGLPGARNAGLAQASGEFVQFLDADDYLGPDKLAHQLAIFASHPKVDIVYGESRYFSDVAGGDGSVTRRWVPMRSMQPVSGTGAAVLGTLLRGNVMAVEAPLVRRSVLERAGGFDTALRRLEDWDCWVRCAESGAVFLYDATARVSSSAFIRVHANSMSHDLLEMYAQALEIHDALERRLPTPGLRRLNRAQIHQTRAAMGMVHALGAEPAKGIGLLLRAGASERRITWLLAALLVPVLRLRPGRWVLQQWRPRWSQRASSTPPI